MQTEFKLRRWNRIAILAVDTGEDHTKPTTLNLAAWDSLGRALNIVDWLVSGCGRVFNRAAH